MNEKDLNSVGNSEPEHKPIVVLDNVTKIFSKTNWAIKKVSLTINKGDSIGVVGANASGKSVLAKLIGNQIPPTSGIIDYFFDEPNIFKAVGFQSREQSWPGGFTGRDVYKLYKSIYDVKDKEWTARLMDVFNIEPILDKPLAKLGVINLQLFAIFLAMLHNPELLIIDEISASVGFEIRMKIIDLLKDYVNGGGTLILVYPDDHILNAVCDRVLTMNAGELQDDMKLKEIIKEYGSTFEYIRSTVASIKTTKHKKTVDPAFNQLTNKFTNLYTTLFTKFEEDYPEGLTTGSEDFDIMIKNTMYYITLSRDTMIETISSSITVQAVNQTEKVVSKTIHEIKATIKAIKKYKKTSEHPVKHLSTLMRNLEELQDFLEDKVRPIFKDDQFVVNAEIANVESSSKERKRLRALKKRYIKEEMRIINLEREKISKRKELASMSAEERNLRKSELIKEQIALENQITSGHTNVIDAINESTNDSTIAVYNENNNIEIVKDGTVVMDDGTVATTLRDGTVVKTDAQTYENKTRIDDELQELDELDHIEASDEMTISAFYEDIDTHDAKAAVNKEESKEGK